MAGPPPIRGRTQPPEGVMYICTPPPMGGVPTPRWGDVHSFTTPMGVSRPPNGGSVHSCAIIMIPPPMGDGHSPCTIRAQQHIGECRSVSMHRHLLMHRHTSPFVDAFNASACAYALCQGGGRNVSARAYGLHLGVFFRAYIDEKEGTCCRMLKIFPE